MLVAHSELVTALATTCAQYALTVSCLHACTEAMLVLPFPLMRLKCTLHLYSLLISRTGDAKLRKLCADTNEKQIYLEKDVEKVLKPFSRLRQNGLPSLSPEERFQRSTVARTFDA